MIGILLAAGLGTRLRPLTLVRPKPLVPLHGIPLLEFSLRQLELAGCRLAAVNGHHLSHALEAWLKERQRARPGLELRFFDEPVLLGVGGGLARMARALPPGPLLVQNGDVLHDAELGRLAELAEEEGVTLFTGGAPLVLEVLDGQVVGFRDSSRSTAGFTGVHIWGEDARARLLAWREADIVPFWRGEIAAGRPVRAVPLAEGSGGGLWVDLGALPRYLPLHRELWEAPAYRALLERLGLEAAWDGTRRVSLGPGSRITGEARDCVAWTGVRWEGRAVDTILLDGVAGQGSAEHEIIL